MIALTLFVRQRCEHLDAHDRRLLCARIAIACDEIVVGLPAAQDEPLDLRLLLDVRIVDNRTERALRHLVDRSVRGLVTQQRLRRHDDERHRRRGRGLHAQEVEVVSGRRGVRDAEVVFGAQLQEALEPRARMLRAAAFVTVRQQQRQTRDLPPLRLPGRDELIDDDLRAVEEVAVLRLQRTSAFGVPVL